MAGSNGILKLQETNREDQIIDIKTRGCTFNTASLFTVTSSTITAAQFMENTLMFDASTPNVLTLDTLKNLFTYYSNKNTIETGSGFYVNIINFDPTNSKTIALPAGMSFLDTQSTSITVTPMQRLVLYCMITMGSSPSIVVYADSVTGLYSIIAPKEGALWVPVSPATPAFFNVAGEAALWDYTNDIAGNTIVSPPLVFQRNGTFNDPTSQISITFPFQAVSRVLTSSSRANAGTAVTSLKFFYTLTAGAATTVSFGSTCTSYNTATANVIFPYFGLSSVAGSANYPLAKILDTNDTMFVETYVFNTPVLLTDGLQLYPTLYSPAGGIPNVSLRIDVLGCMVYFNYQYSV